MLLQDPEHQRLGSATTETPSRHSGAGLARTWTFRFTMLRYHALVYRIAWQLLSDQQEAEDVCQEVFVRYWQRQAQIRSAKVWLAQVTRNEALSRIRKRRRMIYEASMVDCCDLASSQPNTVPVVTSVATPESQAQQAQQATRLHQAVCRLPEPQRSLIVLFDFEGLDGATCAQILDISPNQVKVYLHRARKRLREQLERVL